MSAAAKPITNQKVYVIQDDPRKNIVGAMAWGSLETVLEAREEATPLNIPAIIAKVKYALRHYDPNQDWLVLLGSPIAIGIACAYAAECGGGCFNVLKWDPQERRYWPARINLQQGE